jgi:hypothetical protein
MATQIPDYSSSADGSTALASARISTDEAPARFSTRAQASAVALVVITSSTTTTRFFRNAPFAAVARNAPATFLRRCAAVSPTWLWGALDPGEQETVDGDAGQLASMADWLKRRDQSRER